VQDTTTIKLCHRDHHIGGNLIRTGGAFHYYLERACYVFDDSATQIEVGFGSICTTRGERYGQPDRHDVLGYQHDGRIKQVSSQNASLNFYFTYDTSSPFGLRLVELDTGSAGTHRARSCILQ